MKHAVLIALGLWGSAATASGAAPTVIAVLSSSSQSSRIGDIYSDNTKGGWQDIEKHIQHGTDLAAKFACPSSVKLRHYDTKGTIPGAIAAMKAAESDGAKVIVGFITSSPTLAVNALHQDRKIPLITLMASHDDVPTARPPTMQLSYNNTVQGDRIVQVINGLPASQKRLVGIFTDASNAFSAELSRVIASGLEKAGVAVKSFKYSTPLNWQEYGWSAADLKAVSTVIATGEGGEAIQIITNLSRFNQSYLLVGSDGWWRDDIMPYLVKDIYVPDTIVLGHWSPNFRDKGSVSFYIRYRKAFGYTPGATSALSYDSVAFVCEAVRAGRQLSMKGMTSFRYNGLTGAIEFGEEGRQRHIKPTTHWFHGGKYEDSR